MFVLMKDAGGHQLLLNLDLTFAFIEGERGKAIAMSLSGTRAETGNSFQEVMDDLLAEDPAPDIQGTK
jgi:hypothetical protein